MEGDDEDPTVNCIRVTLGYNMDMDVTEFQASHMKDFQADLSAYIALLAKTDDKTYLPCSYNDAMKYPDMWMLPMESEMGVMTQRGFFSKVERPADRKVIGLKWIYGFKYDAKGEITQRKACLIMQGFNQIPGMDFDQTYTSMAHLESMQMCLAITAHLGLHLWQIDFVAAYLNSDNKFEAYTEQAPGFIHGTSTWVHPCRGGTFGISCKQNSVWHDGWST